MVLIMMKHQNNFIQEDVLMSPEKSKSLILPNHDIIIIKVLYIDQPSDVSTLD